MDELDLILARYNPMSDWPNCSTPDCENKVCTWASKDLCGYCVRVDVGEREFERLYQRTHDSNGYLIKK